MYKQKLKNKPLSFRITLTTIILLLIVLLGQIPTPGINVDYFKSIIESNSALGFLNTLNGDALNKLSLMTLSVSPYITASIIIQLLGICFPSIAELQKSGTTGEKKYKIILISSGAGLGFIQALGMAVGFGKQGLLINYNIGWIALVTFIWTLFATLTVIVGEFISFLKVGNGISLILTVNILSSAIGDFAFLYNKYINDKKIVFAILNSFIILTIIYLIFTYITVVNTAERRLKVTYSGKTKYGNNRAFHDLPIKLCPGGVVPIIFASSLINFPLIIASLFGKGDKLKILNSSYWFTSPKYIIGALLFIGLIFFFSIFYSYIVFNPKEIADNLRKQGACISGIRAGKPTEEYIMSQMNMMIIIGAAALSIIALVPNILDAVFHIGQLSFAGTSMIIVVSVILETRQSIKSQIQHITYKSFL